MHFTNTFGQQRGGAGPQLARGFTLIELLVVISIIGILAVVGLPALKGFGKSNALTSANRQLLDDLALARQAAIAGRTTVYVLFIPPVTQLSGTRPAALSSEEADRLILGQYSSYALFTKRSIGDQPGRSTPRYRGGWRTLPEGIVIAPWMFGAVPVNGIDPFQRPVAAVDGFPYPAEDSVLKLRFPYVAFDYQGRMVYLDNSGNEQLASQDVIIPLARGNVEHDRDASGLTWTDGLARETPAWNSLTNYNHLYIEWLTGRSRVERQPVQ